MDEQILELQKKLTNYRSQGAEPALVFMGMSWLTIKELTNYLYPGKLTSPVTSQ
jgi:hypothetical protein